MQSLFGMGQEKEVIQGTHEGLAALCESQHSFVCMAMLLPGWALNAEGRFYSWYPVVSLNTTSCLAAASSSVVANAPSFSPICHGTSQSVICRGMWLTLQFRAGGGVTGGTEQWLVEAVWSRELSLQLLTSGFCQRSEFCKRNLRRDLHPRRSASLHWKPKHQWRELLLLLLLLL